MNDSLTPPDDTIPRLNGTLDPRIKELIKDGFFLLVVILLFIYILKIIYEVITLIRVMTLPEQKSGHQYPSSFSLICDIVKSIILIGAAVVGILAVHGRQRRFVWGGIYLSVITGSFINHFFSLIFICNSVNHNEYTMSYGLIMFAMVITESLSLNVGSFYTYYLYRDWKEANKDEEHDLWPFG